MRLDLLWSVIDFLDAHSGAITGISTAILVIVTGI